MGKLGEIALWIGGAGLCIVGGIALAVLLPPTPIAPATSSVAVPAVAQASRADCDWAIATRHLQDMHEKHQCGDRGIGGTKYRADGSRINGPWSVPGASIDDSDMVRDFQ